MAQNFDYIPALAVNPSRINLFSLREGSHYREPDQNRFDIKKVSNFHNDKVSNHAKRKISKAVEYLLFMAREKTLPDTYHGKAFNFRIAFITLTLPSSQIHSDNQIKSECLNQLLIELRQKWHVRNYIWRAEKQVNGNIHFHILVDRFIPWSELRDQWNRITNKLGYVDRYRDQMRAFHNGGFKVREDLLKSWEYKAQVKAYQSGKANDWNSPNSTDIHSIKKVSNILKYIIKYTTKDSQTEGLKGRLWSCNEELSNIKGAQVIADSNIKSEIDLIISKYRPDVYHGDHFTSISIEFGSISPSDFKHLFKHFTNYLIDNFNFHYQPYIPT